MNIQKAGDKMNELIDFVICWVDGNDEEWQKEKQMYTSEVKSDSRIIRYRDWDNLQYWFRGVERFAPWVNKVHFVTWGHLPSWLNTNHPKLNVVRHEDYIPKEYLPTFSARPIEVNLHRIRDLSEQFVFFNDDMFLIKPVKESDFFKNGYPRDIAVFDIGIKDDEVHGSAVYNSLLLINKYFNKKEVLRKNFLKWYNPAYGRHLIKTILLSPWKYFTGFYTPHLPNSFLKSTFYEVWEKETEYLELTSSHKFRNKLDLTQYIFKFWQLALGDFVPRRNIGKVYSIGLDFERIKTDIDSQKFKMICINDSDLIEDFEEKKLEIVKSFDKILPEKSEFEI